MRTAGKDVSRDQQFSRRDRRSVDRYNVNDKL